MMSCISATRLWGLPIARLPPATNTILLLLAYRLFVIYIRFGTLLQACESGALFVKLYHAILFKTTKESRVVSQPTLPYREALKPDDSGIFWNL